jgi:hypothetical protein
MGVIFWGNRKLLSKNEKGVRLALKHPLIKGCSVVGRGVYSVVLESRTSVFKLTIDRAAYKLAERQSHWKSPALPVIYGLHGVVGESDYGLPIFLIEMERLEKLKAGTDVRKRSLSVARYARRVLDSDTSSLDRIKRASDSQPEGDFRSALTLLAGFFEENLPDVDLDLHGANFMLRVNTGEAVITDPFMDMKTRTVFFDRHFGVLPEGTVII